MKREFSNIRVLLAVCCLLFTTVGCEAFVRKFTRKPKGETKREEPLIQPQDYPDVALNKEELYKDYFLFWESWADELVSFLRENANAKKQKECAGEALDNLAKMQSLLNDEKARMLEKFILEFTAVRNMVFESYLNSADFSYLRNKVERIKSGVHRGFMFLRVRKELKSDAH